MHPHAVVVDNQLTNNRPNDELSRADFATGSKKRLQGSPSRTRAAMALKTPTTLLALLAFAAFNSSSPPVCVVASTTRLYQENLDTLSKTVTSERLRAVYLMGLEGVGHHYVRSAIKKASSGFPNRIEPASALEYGCQTTMSGTTSQYVQSLDRSREQMKGFASEEQALKEGQAMVVYFGKFISYPYLGGSNKVFQYTDLRLLAEVAEEEEVDLRIVYLKRSAIDLVIADTMHRDFPK